jgi:hypothetical protein
MANLSNWRAVPLARDSPARVRLKLKGRHAHDVRVTPDRPSQTHQFFVDHTGEGMNRMSPRTPKPFPSAGVSPGAVPVGR